jgi:hypothetical protein
MDVNVLGATMLYRLLASFTTLSLSHKRGTLF